ncbi:MAG: hypothetical protein RIS09_139 [Actinomycetota bacterium]|jgi:hypothetical protein
MKEQALDAQTAYELAGTFIEVTEGVTRGVESIEVFTLLTERCVKLLPVEAAGILLKDVTGTLQVIGSSSPSAHLLDLFQIQSEQGPCLECTQSGNRVSDTALSPEGKWPKFSALARQEKYQAVYALPLSSRGVTIGALNLFSLQVLDEFTLDIAQTFADTATVSLLQADVVIDQQIVLRKIHIAVESRNTLEQAQGMISERFSISPDAALEKISIAAKDAHLSLLGAARAIVQRDKSSAIFSILEKK